MRTNDDEVMCRNDKVVGNDDVLVRGNNNVVLWTNDGVKMHRNLYIHRHQIVKKLCNKFYSHGKRLQTIDYRLLTTTAYCLLLSCFLLAFSS